MPHRCLVALCIAICVGIFTAPRSGDADEAPNRKNDERSKALAKVIEVQERHRSQVQSNQLEQILVLDEAIFSIEGDINEFKKFEVSEGGGPRVFKSLKEKEARIQSLEQVRDGWKARIASHEAVLSACATRPIWNCQIPIQNLTLGSIGQFQRILEDQGFLEGLTIPQGKVWTPEMMPPKKSAVSSPKSQAPKTSKPTQQKPKGQPNLAARPPTSNNFRELLGSGESVAPEVMVTAELPDEVTQQKIELYQRVNSGPFHVYSEPFITPWQSKVISVVDEHNVIVELTIPVPPVPAREIEDLTLRKVELRNYYEKNLKKVSTSERAKFEATFLLGMEKLETKIAELKTPKLPTSHSLWIRGAPTKGMVDDQPVKLTQMLIIDGTESYQNAAGVRLTIPKADAINLDELKTLAAKRPTADEYRASKEFSAIQRTREEKSAERLKRQKELAAAEREADEKKAAAKREADGEALAEMEKKAANQLASAKRFIDKMNPKAAILSLEQLIKQYPDTTARLEAEDLLKQLQAGDAKKNDTVEKRVERIEAAEARLATAKQFIEKKSHKSARLLLERLVKEYPETESSEEAKKLLKTLPE